MAVTLAVFAAVQIAMALWVRPHLITPLAATVGVQPGQHHRAVHRVHAGTDDRGRAVNRPAPGSCPTRPSPRPATCSPARPRGLHTGSFQACHAALARLHLRQLVTYQPASRYWAFQWYETAIFLALAVVLAGFCFWWVRRRRLS